MTTEQLNIDLTAAVQKAINDQIEHYVDEELKALRQRLEQRKAEIISGVILKMSKMVEITSLDNRLIITIIKQEPK